MAPPRRTKPAETPTDMFGQQGASTAPPPDVAAPAPVKPKCAHEHPHWGRCTIDADVPHERHKAANGDGWLDEHEKPAVASTPATASAPPPAAQSAAARPPRVKTPGRA